MGVFLAPLFLNDAIHSTLLNGRIRVFFGKPPRYPESGLDDDQMAILPPGVWLAPEADEIPRMACASRTMLRWLQWVMKLRPSSRVEGKLILVGSASIPVSLCRLDVLAVIKQETCQTCDGSEVF